MLLMPEHFENMHNIEQYWIQTVTEGKLGKNWKLVQIHWKTTNLYSQNGFCSHFHNLYPFGPWFYIKFNNVIKKCPPIWPTSTNAWRRKNFFSVEVNLLFWSEFFLIHFGAEKVFFLSICGCWSNWLKKISLTSLQLGWNYHNWNLQNQIRFISLIWLGCAWTGSVVWFKGTSKS
jgi:hypothetical protein